MINDRGGLAVAQLIFYIPALVIAVIVARKHGFGRSSGWFFLIILGVSRIAGSIAQIVAVNEPTNESAQIAAGALSSVGFSTLLAAQLGLLKRPNEGMSRPLIPPRIFNFIIAPIIVAMALGIAGADDAFSTNASTRQQGTTLSKASGIIFLVIFIGMTFMALVTVSQIGSVIQGDRKLVFAVVASEPFLLVRVIYLLLADFSVNTLLFSTFQGNVLVQAFMSVLEEFIVVILYLAAGFFAPEINRAKVQPGSRVGGIEAGNDRQGVNLQYARH